MPLWLSQLHIEYLTNRCRILPRKFLRLPNRFLDVLRRYAFRFEREPERKTAGFGLGSVLYERTNAGAHRNHAQHRTLVLSALLAVGLHRITGRIRARGKRVKPLKAGTRGTISRREPSSLRGDRLVLAPHLGQLRVDGRESILRPQCRLLRRIQAESEFSGRISAAGNLRFQVYHARCGLPTRGAGLHLARRKGIEARGKVCRSEERRVGKEGESR